MTATPLLPENAVVEKHGALRTTSLKVAQAFGMCHDNVLRTLDNLECSQEFNALNFEVVDYIDQKGQFRKAYQMTKNGFMFLVMGFTGKKAAVIKEAYINAFDKIAEQLKVISLTPPSQQHQLTTFLACLTIMNPAGFPLYTEGAKSRPIGHTILSSVFGRLATASLFCSSTE